jgi:hypothetical protein
MAANPNYIDKLWVEYRDLVLPKNAGHAQLTETKRAFFAGCLSMWAACMTDLFEDGSEEPTEQDMQRLAHIQEELAAFGRSGGRL